MNKIIEKGIIAILPEYIKDRGNCTTIWTKDKEEIVLERSVKTVIRNMAKYYHLDLKAANKTYGELLAIKKSAPIPFTKEDIFINVKTRIPLAKDDGAYGYIKVNTIDKVKESNGEEEKATIYLKDGRSIKVYSRIETLNKNISNGEVLKKVLQNKNPLLVKENPSLYLEEDRPATKKDIAMLYMEIMEIKEGILWFK